MDMIGDASHNQSGALLFIEDAGKIRMDSFPKCDVMQECDSILR